MSECNSSKGTYYQRNRDVKLNRAKKYYKNNKKVLKDRAKDKYRDISDEEKKYKERMRKKQMS